MWFLQTGKETNKNGHFLLPEMYEVNTRFLVVFLGHTGKCQKLCLQAIARPRGGWMENGGGWMERARGCRMEDGDWIERARGCRMEDGGDWIDLEDENEGKQVRAPCI
jgi:hypothetical protein